MIETYQCLTLSLEKSPGGNIGFESAPFKLTSEYVDVMGGGNSKGFQKFR